jgi:hypothetical protein
MNRRKISSLIDCQKIIFASVSESSRLTFFHYSTDKIKEWEKSQKESYERREKTRKPGKRREKRTEKALLRN